MPSQAYVGKNLTGRLLARLLLKMEGPGWPLRGELIPVIEVTPLLIELQLGSETKDISASSGATTYFTVPANKIWTVAVINRPATTGTSQVYVKDDQGRNIALDGSGTSASIIMTRDLRLKTGWQIQLLNTNNVGDTAVLFRIIYGEEDA